MDYIELVEVQMKYADDIWKFRQEILECDAENEAVYLKPNYEYE